MQLQYLELMRHTTRPSITFDIFTVNIVLGDNEGFMKVCWPIFMIYSFGSALLDSGRQHTVSAQLVLFHMTSSLYLLWLNYYTCLFLYFPHYFAPFVCFFPSFSLSLSDSVPTPLIPLIPISIPTSLSAPPPLHPRVPQSRL